MTDLESNVLVTSEKKIYKEKRNEWEDRWYWFDKVRELNLGNMKPGEKRQSKEWEAKNR